MVVIFGTMFNNIRLVRYNKAGTTEIERITVPLSYANKEKFYARITQDPNLNKQVQMVLPRMSFELTAITYDPLRKNSSHINQFGTSNSNFKRVRSAPYNFEFTLNIYVRNTEDGTQIVEQILPYFSPDYTVTADLIGLGQNLKVDVPIILNSVNYDASNDTGSPEDTRVIIWTLTFTAKGYMYGPVKGDGDGGLIRKVVANTHIMETTTDNQKILTLNNGSGTFKYGELVYVGNSVSEANTSAFVKTWSPSSNTLTVVDTSGSFSANNIIRGAISGAKWNISSVGVDSGQAVLLTIEPNPLTANVNDDFGFTETIYEYPDIP